MYVCMYQPTYFAFDHVFVVFEDGPFLLGEKADSDIIHHLYLTV